MPITTVDVVTNAHSSIETINNGSIVVSCLNTGEYHSSISVFATSISYNTLEDIYEDRFDDVYYYNQIGSIESSTTTTTTGGPPTTTSTTVSPSTTTSTTISPSTTTSTTVSPLNWKLIGSAYWNNYVSVIDSTISSETISDVLTVSSAEFDTPSATSQRFAGGVLLLDGRIFCIPYVSNTALIYNPDTDSVTSVTGSYGARFRGGVLMHNEKVLVCPQTGAFIQIYDPVLDTTTVTTSVIFLDQASGCVLLPNGNVYFIPFVANSHPIAKIYNPTTNTLSNAGGTFSGAGTFGGGILLPNGKVFCIPANSTTARIYDPATNTLSIPAGTYPGSDAFYGGVLLSNGKVVLIPKTATKAYIYDYNTDTLTTSAPDFPGSNAFLGGCYLSDGTIYCSPYNSTVAKIYDPINDTLTTANGSYNDTGNAGFYNAVSIENGKAFPVPHTSQTGKIYGGGNGFDINILLSAYYNKG